MPGYDPSSLKDRRAYAMMMRDVDRKNWETASRMFRRAQRRGEQPLVPPWLKEAFAQGLDRLDEWRDIDVTVGNYGMAA